MLSDGIEDDKNDEFVDFTLDKESELRIADIENAFSIGGAEFLVNFHRNANHTHSKILSGLQVLTKDHLSCDNSLNLTNFESKSVDINSNVDIENAADNVNFSVNTKSSPQKSPLVRFRNGKLSVTDLVGPKWCEIQYEYYMKQGGKQETQAMSTGKNIHLALELETHDVRPVTIHTVEDRWGLRLINLLTSVESLSTGDCVAREVPIFGILNGLFVNGVIDEIRKVPLNADLVASFNNPDKLDRYVKTSRPVEIFEWVISDTKTRTHASLPKKSQSNISKQQLFLYKRLWDKMILDAKSAVWDQETGKLSLSTEGNKEGDFSIFSSKVFAQTRVNMEREFSTSFLLEAGLNSQFLPKTILQLLRVLQLTLMEAEISSETLEIVYRWQGFRNQDQGNEGLKRKFQAESGIILGTDRFQYNSKECDSWLSHIKRYWTGNRPPMGVMVDEADWKCRSCEFRDTCSWREEKAREHVEMIRQRRE